MSQAQRERPLRSEFSSFWPLDPSFVFLNHGSFGATPTPILEEQFRIRFQMESQPVHFLARALEDRLDAARQTLASLIHANPADLVFLPNATTAVNSVVASLDLHDGDELLSTTQAYNACNNALRHAAARVGARVVFADIPFPLSHPEQVTEAILASISSRTRLVLLDHITSPTAVRFPIEQIVPLLREKGIETLVDGAHALGQTPIALDALGAGYYTSNAHKWLCAPKGCAFLHVRRDLQPRVRPAVLSHGANSLRKDRSKFLLEFDWTGTIDPTAYLALPSAVQFLSSLLPGGLPALQERNHRLALRAQQRLCTALDIPLPVPESMLGAMTAVPLPLGTRTPQAPLYLDPLQDDLRERHKVEIVAFSWPKFPERLLRASFHAYNSEDEAEFLVDVMREELQRETALRL